MISDFALVSQLYSFMDVIPILWKWDSLQSSYGNGQTYTEERGPHGNFLQFEFQVLEEEADSRGRYLHICVSVTDASRANGARGSSTAPLSTSFLFFASGEVDMPLARQIYESPF